MKPSKATGNKVQKYKLPKTVRRARLMNDLSGYAFISPFILAFVTFMLVPVLMSIYYSFTEYDILEKPVFHGLANFSRMWNDPLFWKSLKVTFQYAFVSVPLRLLFAFAVAMLFNREAKGMRIYQMIYYIPSIVGGSIAVAVMWRRMFMSEGAVNSMLNALGVTTDISWIGNPKTALWTLIILAAWQFGSSMLIFLAGLKQIPKLYYEAADIDGASPWRKFLSITVPYLTPVIFFNLIMQLIAGFTVFTQAFIISGGSGDPMNSTLAYTLYLYQRGLGYRQMGYASALAWILVLIIGLFTAIVFKSSSSWVFYEAKDGK